MLNPKGVPTPVAAVQINAPSSSMTVLEEVFDSPMAKTAARQAVRTVTQQLVRGIFGMLRGR